MPSLLLTAEVVYKKNFSLRSLRLFGERCKSVQLKARSESGEELLITGDVSCVCPTKIPMPGGAIFVNEGLTEFRWGDRIGHGIAEHWHGVRL